MLELKEFQRRDVDILKSHNGIGLVATEVGGGKTFVAAQTFVELGVKNVLIIAPKNVIRRTWIGFMQSQYGIEVRRVDSTKKGKAAYQDLISGKDGWFIITWEYFRRFESWVKEGKKVQGVIADEAHRIGNRKSQTSKKLRNWQPQYRIALTGTPAGNKPANLWAVCRWVFGKTEVDTFHKWRDRWFITAPNPWATYDPDIVSEREEGEFIKSLSCYVRHEKTGSCCEYHPKGMDSDFPEPRWSYRNYTLSKVNRKIYEDLQNTMITFLEENPLVVDLPIVLRNRLRTLTLGVPTIEELDEGKIRLYFEPGCESACMDATLEDMADYPEGHKFVLFVTSPSFADALQARLESEGYSTTKWHGKMGDSDREKQLDEFLAGNAQTFIATVQSIGEGTDGLQHVAHTALWLARTDNMMQNNQAAGRLARTGQTQAVHNIEYVAENTYDEGIISSHLKRQLKLNALLKKEREETK